jgi:N4-gp56 family major capsid protein
MAYAPAGNMTSTGTIAHLATVYYQRRGLSQLKKRFRFLSATQPDELPLRNGVLIQWYRYGLYGANTTPSAEGTVGTSLPLTTSTVRATVQEYSDYVSLSKLLVETAIDPIASNAAEQLGYRAGLSVDTITRIEFDSVASTATDFTTLGAYATVNDIRKAVAVLKGADVRPMDSDDNFLVICHPYVTFDIMSDNTAGGFIDITKYGAPERNFTGEVGKVYGARIVESTNVGTSGTAPNVLYMAYVVGQGAVGAVNLQGAGPSNVSDPEKQSFRINTFSSGPNPADPEGKIGSYCSYRFVFATKILDTSTYRFRRIKCDASLV